MVIPRWISSSSPSVKRRCPSESLEINPARPIR